MPRYFLLAAFLWLLLAISYLEGVSYSCVAPVFLESLYAK